MSKIIHGKPTQEELGLFVSKQVILCQSSLVEEILHEGKLFSFEDIRNGDNYICPECGQGQNEPFDSTTVKENDESFDAPMKYKCYECNNEFEKEPECQPKEIYEWWIVTDWLLDKLEAHGEAVLRTDYGEWWGRTCTGQSIVLDSVIEDIYKAMMKA